MPTEQRIIASKPTIGSSGKIGASAPAVEEAPPAKGGKKKVVLIVLLAVLLLGGGAAWYFLMGPGAGEATEEVAEPAPVPGEVVTVEAVSINLAGGHYLRLGFALQLTEEVHEEVSTATALDLAISHFSGRAVEEVGSTEGRAALKEQFRLLLVEAYEGEVMDVYLTDYVTQ